MQNYKTYVRRQGVENDFQLLDAVIVISVHTKKYEWLVIYKTRLDLKKKFSTLCCNAFQKPSFFCSKVDHPNTIKLNCCTVLSSSPLLYGLYISCYEMLQLM